MLSFLLAGLAFSEVLGSRSLAAINGSETICILSSDSSLCDMQALRIGGERTERVKMLFPRQNTHQ